jgi:hypothetical protein
MACDPTNDEELILVKYRGVSSPALWYRSADGGLCPMGGFQIEDNEVGEVDSMFVLAAKDQELVSLVECGSVP